MFGKLENIVPHSANLKTLSQEQNKKHMKSYNHLYLKVLKHHKTLAEKMAEVDDLVLFAKSKNGELRPDTTKYQKKRSWLSWFSGLLVI